ncbi:MAG: hypothetical protein ACQBVK_04250 [Candidatus Phytoplasma sp. TWB_XP]
MNCQSHNQTKSVWKITLVIVVVLLICAGLLWLSVNFNTERKLSSQGRDDNVDSNYYPHQSNTKPQTPPNPSRIKRSTEETPQPKIKTTDNRLDQIKNYLFTEPTDNSKLPSDLSPNRTRKNQ